MDSPAPRSGSWPGRNSGHNFCTRHGGLGAQVGSESRFGPISPINTGRPEVSLHGCSSCRVPETFSGDPRLSDSHQPSQTGSLKPQRSDRLPLAASNGAGMIVLSTSGRMLHMNGQARTFMALFGDAYELWPHLAPDSLPSILTEFCREAFAQLQNRIEGKDWAQLEVRRVCHMVTPPLLIRGFCVPHSGRQEPRMILTLQPAPLDASTPQKPTHAPGIPDAPAERRRANS